MKLNTWGDAGAHKCIKFCVHFPLFVPFFQLEKKRYPTRNWWIASLTQEKDYLPTQCLPRNTTILCLPIRRATNWPSSILVLFFAHTSGNLEQVIISISHVVVNNFIVAKHMCTTCYQLSRSRVNRAEEDEFVHSCRG